MKSIFIFCAFSFFFGSKVSQASEIFIQQNKNYSYSVFLNNDETYGYDIFKNGKRIIHQVTIPAYAGAKGFEKMKDAESTAKLVIEKLKSGEMPPSVTLEDLKKLSVSLSFK